MHSPSLLYLFRNNAIRVAARFQMAVVRDAFVTSLAKFTTLDTVREMTSKNVECIKTLIAIALQVRTHLLTY